MKFLSAVKYVSVLSLVAACSPTMTPVEDAGDSGVVQTDRPNPTDMGMTTDNPSPSDVPNATDVPTATDVPMAADVPGATDVPNAADVPTPATPVTMGAVLSGGQEVPPVVTNARGVAAMSFNPATRILTFNITHSVVMPTAAHIHIGAAGMAGGVAVAFPAAASPIMGTLEIPAANVAALMSGGLYVNVHSMANAGGEIRGQIVPANYFVNMNGANEVPAVNTMATGVGLGNYDAMTGNMTLRVEHNVAMTTAAHIHIGTAGMAGGVAVALPMSASPIMGTVAIPMANQAALMSGGLYVNVHSMANAGGEIRGQLTRIAF